MKIFTLFRDTHFFSFFRMHGKSNSGCSMNSTADGTRITTMQEPAAWPEIVASRRRAGTKCFNQKTGPIVKQSEGKNALSHNFLDAGNAREAAKGELNEAPR